MQMLSNEMKDSRNVGRAIFGYTSYILYRRTMKKPCIFIWFDLAYILRYVFDKSLICI